MDVANKTRLLKAKLRIQLITFPSFIYILQALVFIYPDDIYNLFASILLRNGQLGSGHGPVSIFLSLGFFIF